VFSALLLVGTILFVMLWLPHIVRVKEEDRTHSTRLLDRVANLPIEKNRYGIVLIGVLTLVFGWFSFGTRFDANIGHLNYMTPEQRTDMEFLQQLTSAAASGKQCIYAVSRGSSMDEALDRSGQIYRSLNNIAGKYPGTEVASCQRFLCSKDEQMRRIRLWESFVSKYANLLGPQLAEKAAEAGFSGDAFAPFYDIINGQYHRQDFAYFRPMQDLYATHISTDSLTGIYRVVDAITVKSADTESVGKEIKAVLPKGAFFFDIESMNRELTGNLTDNFNYLGWACAAIVFLFLWFSFRSFKLALLTFLPMTISWIWILGIMGLLGIQFNLVNIILATFIFGQGDDYTIFITEGCLQEYTYGRKVLLSHKRSVALSALIMFVGIGSLIFARHPALHSLAEVTIVGMFSVVLMAYVIPPLLFSLPPLRGTKTHNP
jgi:predicted exporter